MATRAIKTPPARNEFGALIGYDSLAAATLGMAYKAGKLTQPFFERDYKKSQKHETWIGNSLNIDVYDVTKNGSVVLVQVRETEGTKYGRNIKKTYYIVRKLGKQVIVTEADKARACKVSKAATKLGGAIAKLTEGLSEYREVKKSGYRIVEKRGEEYINLSKEFRDLRVYPTAEAAKAAQNVFENCEGKALVVVKLSAITYYPFRSSFKAFWKGCGFRIERNKKILRVVEPFVIPAKQEALAA